jgi:hypothetical protein
MTMERDFSFFQPLEDGPVDEQFGIGYPQSMISLAFFVRPIRPRHCGLVPQSSDRALARLEVDG